MAQTVYNNFVIENKFQDILTTKVNMSDYMTINTELTAQAGDKVKVHRYTVTGDVEELDKGEGNTGLIESSYTEKEYVTKVLQGKAKYADEELKQDPIVLDNLLRGLADTMTNKLTANAIAEYADGTQVVDCDFDTTNFFDAVADALAYFGEKEENLTILVSPTNKAWIRKTLGDDLKYSESFIKTGAIGTVCGVPVVVSKAVPNDEAYVVSPEAVTCYIAKAVESETDRDPDTRTNYLYIRTQNITALTDATKVVVLKDTE